MNVSGIQIISSAHSSKEQPLYLFGSSELIEQILIFVFPPFTTLAIVSNLISYRVFSSSRLFQKPLYVYLKATCLNSMFINFMFGLSFIWTSRFFGPFCTYGFHKWQIYFQSYLYFPLVMSSYSFGCFLEVVLALERFFQLTGSRHRFQHFRASTICIGLLLFSLFIHLPMIFSHEPKKHIIYNYRTNTSEEVFYPGQTAFNSSTTGGYIIPYLRFIIRDVFPLVALSVINVVSYVQFKRKYNKRNSSEDSLFVSKSYLNQRPSKTQMTFRNKCLAVNKMLIKMVMIICMISTFQSIYFITSFVILRCFISHVNGVIVFMVLFTLYLKHSVNFLIFYNNNSFFKSKLKESMKKRNKFLYIF